MPVTLTYLSCRYMSNYRKADRLWGGHFKIAFWGNVCTTCLSHSTVRVPCSLPFVAIHKPGHTAPGSLPAPQLSPLQELVTSCTAPPLPLPPVPAAQSPSLPPKPTGACHHQSPRNSPKLTRLPFPISTSLHFENQPFPLLSGAS